MILSGQLYLYADDSSVRPGSENDACNLIQQDMDRLAQRSDKGKLIAKVSKSCEVIFHSRHRHRGDNRPIYLKGDKIAKAASHKHLGVTLDEYLSFEAHIQNVIIKYNNNMLKVTEVICKIQVS
jgi:hypothetical protein